MREKTVMLVVDDMEVNRKALRSIFENEYEVLEAADGEEALGILGKRQVDIVILDIVMPGLDGAGVLRRMRADHALREIPVLVKTAVDENMEAMMLERGADDFIFSPYEPAVVMYRVRNLMQRYRFRKALYGQEESEHQKKRLTEEECVRQVSEEIIREGQALLECCGNETDEENWNMVRMRAARILALARRMSEASPPDGSAKTVAEYVASGSEWRREVFVREKRTLDGLRVLLLDDNELTRSYHQSMLARLGVRCCHTANGADTMHELKQAQMLEDGYDIILISWSRTEAPGVVREIRNVFAEGDIFIVGITGAQENEEAQMLASGVDYILEKPVYQAVLYRFLTDVCGGILQRKRSVDA